jgi:two-component system sensor histidine kinase TctE
LRAALSRIRTAAEQMKHRVDELFLLAEAQAGEEVKLGDDVELDGLVLECTDLMRGRAFSLGRTLAIGQAVPILVKGNATLLREALVELIENGCKHGDASFPVTVSAELAGNAAVISVETAGPAFTLSTREDAVAPAGTGLPIVQWIARAHHGELSVTSDKGKNNVSIRMPLQTSQPGS